MKGEVSTGLITAASTAASLQLFVQTGLANGAQMALQWTGGGSETVRPLRCSDGREPMGWECVHQGSWLLQIQDFIFGGCTPYVQVNDLGREVVGVPDGYERVRGSHVRVHVHGGPA